MSHVNRGIRISQYTYMYHMYIHILGNLFFWPLTLSFWPLTLSFWPLTLSFWPLTLCMHMQEYIPILKKTTFWVHCIISPTSNYIVHPKNANGKTVNPFTPLSFSKSEIPRQKNMEAVWGHQSPTSKRFVQTNICKNQGQGPSSNHDQHGSSYLEVPKRWSKQLLNRMNKEKHHPLGVLKGGVGGVPKIQTCIFGVLVDDVGSPIIPYLCEVKQHPNWDHVVSLCHVFITASTVKTLFWKWESQATQQRWHPWAILWCSPRDFVAGQEPVDMDPVGRRQYGEAKLMRYPKHIFEECIPVLRISNLWTKNVHIYHIRKTKTFENNYLHSFVLQPSR